MSISDLYACKDSPKVGAKSGQNLTHIYTVRRGENNENFSYILGR